MLVRDVGYKGQFGLIVAKKYVEKEYATFYFKYRAKAA